MWVVLERVIIWLAIVIMFTQVIVPILLDRPLFWLFRKKDKSEKTSNPVTFDETVESLKERKVKLYEEGQELKSEIEEKVEKVKDLTKPIETKAQESQEQKPNNQNEQ